MTTYIHYACMILVKVGSRFIHSITWLMLPRNSYSTYIYITSLFTIRKHQILLKTTLSFFFFLFLFSFYNIIIKMAEENINTLADKYQQLRNSSGDEEEKYTVLKVTFKGKYVKSVALNITLPKK